MTETAVALPVALPVLRLLPAPSSEPPYDDERAVAPLLRLVPPAPPSHTAQPSPGPAAPTSPTSPGLPDVRPVAHALVQLMLEVCGGVRPVTQLRPRTTPLLYADLERALLRRPRATGPRPSARDIRSVHVQQREDGVAEACATVSRGGRTTALALRMEAVQGCWLCTVVQGL